MTSQEFKAWFTGYTECIEDLPSVKQWKRIRDRVAEIDNVPTTHPVFIDRYWRWPVLASPPPIYGPYYYVSNSMASSCMADNISCVNGVTDSVGSVSSMMFNSADAFTTLGKTDAQMDN